MLFQRYTPLASLGALLLLGSFANCSMPERPIQPVDRIGAPFPYDLLNPVADIELPKSLVEISGLAWFGKNRLAGVQDEDGYIFIIDTKKGEIDEKEKFRKDGDYEGIAMVGKKLYIVRSDGDLFKVKDFDKDDQKTKHYETDLSEANDVEGLCYSKQENALWLVCKDRAGLDKKKLRGKRAVYAFDLESKELNPKPRFIISENAINEKLKTLYTVEKDRDFMPSAIEIHPKTGEVYILAHQGHLLVVLSPDGKIHDAAILPRKQFPQAEGITFAPNGDLFISNEGVSHRANILKFAYEPS